MNRDSPVIIVGGGIWGFSTAWHLARAGCDDVCVVERNSEPAVETTPRAAGLVGQLRSTPVMCRAIQYGLEVLDNFAADSGHDLGLRRTGSLMVALTDERMEAFGRQVAAARESDVEARLVDHAEIARLAPGLDVAKLTGGCFIPGDGYVDPRRCALAFAQAATDLDVATRFSTEVTGLLIENNQIRGVTTTGGELRAERVIVTAGPWTRQLVSAATVDLPLETIRHQRVRTGPAADIPEHHPVVRVHDLSCYVRPEQGGYLYGYFEPTPSVIDLAAEPSTLRTADIPEPVATMEEARRRLATVFPSLASLPVAERFQGITTFAPDGRYLIGPVRDVEGLYAATGCAALGIAGAAAVGHWLAQCIVDSAPDFLASEFGLDRFDVRGDDREWISRAAVRYYASSTAWSPAKSRGRLNDRPPFRDPIVAGYVPLVWKKPGSKQQAPTALPGGNSAAESRTFI